MASKKSKQNKNKAPAINIAQDSLARSCLEVYKTNDKNIKKKSDKSTDGFILQNGEIIETAYFDEMINNSFEYDYEDISSQGNISFSSIDETRFYKGKKVLLKKAWEKPEKTLKFKDLKNCLMGFIVNQSFSEGEVEIKIAGMGKLLDKEKQFSFTQTKRSKILKEMIESAGLKAKINVSGLKDEKIDYSNVSSNSSSSDLAGGEGEDIDSLVRKIVGDETDDLKKCKLIHKWLQENVRYPSPSYACSRYSTAKACLANKGALNCADTSRLTRAMMSSAGLNAWVVHRYSNNGHFWTLIKINGKIYASDQTGNGSAFNTIWYSEGDRRACDERGGNWEYNRGKNPSC